MMYTYSSNLKPWCSRISKAGHCPFCLYTWYNSSPITFRLIPRLSSHIIVVDLFKPSRSIDLQLRIWQNYLVAIPFEGHLSIRRFCTLSLCLERPATPLGTKRNPMRETLNKKARIMTAVSMKTRMRKRCRTGTKTCTMIRYLHNSPRSSLQNNSRIKARLEPTDMDTAILGMPTTANWRRHHPPSPKVRAPDGNFKAETLCAIVAGTSHVLGASQTVIRLATK